MTIRFDIDKMTKQELINLVQTLGADREAQRFRADAADMLLAEVKKRVEELQVVVTYNGHGMIVGQDDLLDMVRSLPRTQLKKHDIELAESLGWYPFGYHAGSPGVALEFRGTDDDGLPKWERPI